jgi:5-methylcytosine-specific restriction enzyme subunit McrC
MQIPIRNLFYLLCYAWNRLEARNLLRTAVEEAERPDDLLARMLLEGTQQLLRRGLDRGYREYSDDLRSPRGRMDVPATVKRNLLARPSVHCHLDELSHDVAHNRTVKAVLVALSRSPDLPPGLRTEISNTVERLHAVTTVPFSGALLRHVQIHRNIHGYGLLMDVCRLLARHLLPDASGGGVIRMKDFTGSDQEMGRLFEDFLRNFLRREQSWFRVRKRQVPWDGAGLTETARALLPVMETDITLTSPEQRVVIEAKFYTEPLARQWGKKTIRSGHLYQLLSYLRSLAAEDPSRSVSGMLLYAQVGEAFDLHYEIHGHQVRVRSLDLGQPWRMIHDDLLAIAEAPALAA